MGGEGVIRITPKKRLKVKTRNENHRERNEVMGEE